MLENKAEFEPTELKAILNGAEFHNLDNAMKIIGISIDTRTIQPGNAFIALKGQSIDGHTLINDAFSKSASICFIEKEAVDYYSIDLSDKPFIVTDNNLATLGEIASYHRSRFDIPIIAVTGSNGKTTTKEMIADILSTEKKVLRTYKNFNNLLGVSLMLLMIDGSHDIAVLELGTNQPGEIYELGLITKPTHALVTNIGKEHLEFLIDLDGVELEETYIFSQVCSGGFAFINFDDPRLKQYGHIIGKFLTYGTDKDANLLAEITLSQKINPIISFKHDNGNFAVNMQTIGLSSAHNAIAACAVGIHFEIKAENIKSALEKFNSPLYCGYGRMALEIHSGLNIINDCYNANPDSMLVALDTLSKFSSDGKKIAIIGDMRELGHRAYEEHKNILEIASSIADFVFLTGDEFTKVIESSVNTPSNVKLSPKEEIPKLLTKVVNIRDTLLFKASRGIKLEEVINEFKKII